jgi:hypothetical protein
MNPFTQKFGPYASTDDSIYVMLPNGWEARAQLAFDADTQPTASMHDDDRARWNNDEWRYVSIAVEIYADDIFLGASTRL